MNEMTKETKFKIFMGNETGEKIALLHHQNLKLISIISRKELNNT